MTLNEKMALKAEIAAVVTRHLSYLDTEATREVYDLLATARGAMDETITKVLEAHAFGSFRDLKNATKA